MRKAVVVVVLLAAAALAGPRRRASGRRPEDPSLTFTFDSGYRIEQATNPAAGIDPATGDTYLYYNDHVTGRMKVAVAHDGLTFGAANEATTFANDPRNTLMPGGKTWRRYQWDLYNSEMLSLVSTDGVHFTNESGVRYHLQPADHGTLGVYDAFADKSGGVVLLYLGDLMGLNNARRAVSRDNGLTFTFDRGNILGDDNAGGGANSYVDEKSIRLPDGRIRLFTMRQNTIYSFLSSDDGYSFSQEPGVRLARSAFSGATLTSLNDPVAVRLADGRYRIYVAALRSDNVWVIVSATSK